MRILLQTPAACMCAPACAHLHVQAQVYMHPHRKSCQPNPCGAGRTLPRRAASRGALCPYRCSPSPPAPALSTCSLDPKLPGDSKSRGPRLRPSATPPASASSSSIAAAGDGRARAGSTSPPVARGPSGRHRGRRRIAPPRSARPANPKSEVGGVADA
eukprot:355528-Chlamydomonas_euryale.AAC.13